MNTLLLSEPELTFGTGNHIDIKFGLLHFGPFDANFPQAPREIKLGIVGTSETIEHLTTWISEIKNGVAAKKSKKENLFPLFPGYGEGTTLPATFVCDSSMTRSIPQNVIRTITELNKTKNVIQTVVDIFYEEAKYICQNKSVDILLFAPPFELLALMQVAKSSFNFHDLLKARVMGLKKPCQIILPTTYGLHPTTAMQVTRKALQDEATRAWNFYIALYYKAGGIPWRILRRSDEYATCYIGIGFYHTLDNESVETSVAQIFNERGEGIILRGEQAHFSKDDRQPHMSSEDAYKIITESLKKYKSEHQTLPARIVIYKTSQFTSSELDGIEKAIKEKEINLIDCVSVYQSEIRLFRTKEYPPLRGTFFSMDETNHLLYTRGSVQFYETYPGLYIPVPLAFRCDRTEATPKFLAEEMLALTKMNWNNTQFDNISPITITAAQNVSKILKYLGKNDEIESRYSYYM